MNCQTFRTQHLEYVDLALADDVRRAMIQHLEACETCGRFDTAIRRGLLVIRNLPDVRPSSAFSARLDAKLRSARLAETELQRSHMHRRPATVRTVIVVAASLAGMIYLAEPSARAASRMIAVATARDAARAPETPRPTPRIYSAPLRSPAVVTVVSTAPNAEWMSPTPGAPPPSAFAPALLETVALAR